MKTPIIWNITNKCPYHCSICCISANNNSSKDLSLEEKLKIITNLDSSSIKIDLSGGDPLYEDENLEVLKKLSKKFGKENISITSTGKGLEKITLFELKDLISEVGFTYDFPREPSPDRPKGYNLYNLKMAEKLTKMGIRTMAQIPLTKSNLNKEIIEEIYINLNLSGIKKLLLIRFSESGKGKSKKNLSLDQKEIKRVISEYKKLKLKYGSPKLLLTPFIRGNFIGNMFTSLNITNQGLLVSTPWAYDVEGKPLERYILGDLKREKMSKIAGRNIYERFFTQLNRNLIK